jgi:hypothetical protein
MKGRVTALQIVYGFAGLVCALNAINVSVAIIQAGLDAIAKNNNVDAGLIGALAAPVCISTALAVFFLRLALKSRCP